MQTLRVTDKYEYIRDTLMGTTRIVRRSDSFMTFWNTGTDAETEMENVESMTDAEFDEYADGHEFY